MNKEGTAWGGAAGGAGRRRWRRGARVDEGEVALRAADGGGCEETESGVAVWREESGGSFFRPGRLCSNFKFLGSRA